MALNFGKQNVGITLVPQNTVAPSVAGDIRYNVSSNKLEVFNGALDSLVGEASAATLTNKILTGNTAVNLLNGSAVITLPSATDTLVGKATADTLTNKTIAAGSNTITGLTNSNLSGTAAISDANLATMPNNTIKGNISGVTGAPSNLTPTQVNSILGTIAGIGTIDTQTPSSNGLVIAGGSVFAQSASATVPGMVNTTTQTLAGNKTFSGTVQALSAYFTSFVTSPQVSLYSAVGGQSIGLQISDSPTAGYTLKFPPAQATAASQVLFNDGSGNLSWNDVSVVNVGARYHTAAFSLSGSYTKLTFTVKDYDTANVYATGLYTVAKAGKYLVSSSIETNTLATLTYPSIAIFKNGSIYSVTTTFSPANSGAAVSSRITDIVSCIVGDTIAIYGAASPSGVSGSGSAFSNYLAITYQGT